MKKISVPENVIENLYEAKFDIEKDGSKSIGNELKAFVQKHFPEEKGYSEKVDSVLSDVIDIYLAERKKGFTEGFKAALEYVESLSE